jgi:hypothetical protein
MERTDPLDDRVQAAAEEMESDVAEMEEHSERVGEQIDETRSNWKRKQDDPSIPGAESGGEPESEEVAGDWEGEGPAANKAGQ